MEHGVSACTLSNPEVKAVLDRLHSEGKGDKLRYGWKLLPYLGTKFRMLMAELQGRGDRDSAQVNLVDGNGGMVIALGPVEQFQANGRTRSEQAHDSAVTVLGYVHEFDHATPD